MSPTTAATSFAEECREAFLRLAREHAAINPNERGRRLQNQKLRLRKHVAIDAVLDQYADWLDLQAHEADLGTTREAAT